MTKTLSKKPTTASTEYPWSPDKKADIRDVSLHYKSSKDFWEYISKRLVDVDLEVSGEEITPEVCTSFEDLIEVYQKNLHWTPLAKDALACCIAVIISVRIKGPLLWAYLVGGSGSGKSTICDALAADSIHTKRVSQFTGLHSGHKTEDGSDVSLVSKLFDKGMIVPDFTSILGLSPMMQEKIYAELRAIYDGSAQVHYGNAIERDYRSMNFSTLAGVTHEIHTIKKSALGERFMKIDMTQPTINHLIVMRAIDNVANAATESLKDNAIFDKVEETNPFMKEIKAHTLGFLQHIFRRIAGGITLPPIPIWFKLKLAALAQIVAACRAQVSREQGGDRDMVIRPILEVGSHIAGQLTKLASALCVVLDRDYDQEVLRLVQKVAMDTAYGFNRDIITALAESPNGLTKEQVASRARIPTTTTYKMLRDLHELGVAIYKREESAAGIGGRDAHVHYLSNQLQHCWEEVFGRPEPVRKTLRKFS